jgi:hypothetical protein
MQHRHKTQWEMAKQSAPIASTIPITFDVVKQLWSMGHQAEAVTGSDGWIKSFELPDAVYVRLYGQHITDYQS